MAAAAALLLTLLLAGMDREIGSEEEAAIVLGNSEGRADMLGLSGMSKLESIKRLLARSRRRLEADSENVDASSRKTVESERGLVRMIKRDRAVLQANRDIRGGDGGARARGEGAEGAGGAVDEALRRELGSTPQGEGETMALWGHQHHLHLLHHRQEFERRSTNAWRSPSGIGEGRSDAKRLLSMVETLSGRLLEQQRIMKGEELALAAARREAKAMLHGSSSSQQLGSHAQYSPFTRSRITAPASRGSRSGHHQGDPMQLPGPSVDLRAPRSYASDQGPDGSIQEGYVGRHSLASSAESGSSKLSYIESVFGRRGRASQQQR